MPEHDKIIYVCQGNMCAFILLTQQDFLYIHLIEKGTSSNTQNAAIMLGLQTRIC
jgi:hypothetical protein